MQPFVATAPIGGLGLLAPLRPRSFLSCRDLWIGHVSPGSDTLDIDGGSGTVVWNYGITHSGKTTVTAIPGVITPD